MNDSNDKETNSIRLSSVTWLNFSYKRCTECLFPYYYMDYKFLENFLCLFNFFVLGYIVTYFLYLSVKCLCYILQCLSCLSSSFTFLQVGMNIILFTSNFDMVVQYSSQKSHTIVWDNRFDTLSALRLHNDFTTFD